VEFTEIHLPEEFVRLLQHQSKSQTEGAPKTTKFLEQYPSLKNLAMRTLEEFDPKKARLEVIINTLGWHSFRDRLAAVFIQKKIEGHYSFQSDIKLVSDVVALEERLLKHSVLSMPNSFFISLYFKFLSLEAENSNGRIEDLPFYNRIEQSISLLPRLKSRVVKIDWLLLQLIHFNEYIDQEKIAKKIESGKYDDLYGLLSSRQKSEMINNLLSYGYALGDKDSLIPPAEAV
jgi:hypothetical protein